MGDEGGSKRSLDAELVKGVAWTGVANWLAQALTWASTLLVVRILTPDDYGLVALAAVYMGFAVMLSEFGIGLAVVSLRDITIKQTAQLNAVALMLAGAAIAGSWALARPLAVYFNTPRLATVILVLSLGLLFSAISSVSHALLQKALRFKYLAMAQVAQSVVGSLTTLALAYLGAGYWALALGHLAGHAAVTAAIVIGSPCGYAWPRWGELRSVIQFTRHVLVERIAWYGATSSDKVVIGKWIGEIPLGIYSIATTFGLLAVEKVTVLMLRVAPAVFSEVQTSPPALLRYLLMMTEGLALVTFPISVGLSLVAPDFVHTFLGPQWEEVIVPLQLLGVFGAYQSVTALLPRLLAVTGDVKHTMQVAVLSLIVMPIAFFVGGQAWGLPGVAAAWLCAYPLTQAPMYLRLHRRVGLTVGKYVRALWPAASGAGIMALGVLLLPRWPTFDAMGAPMRLFVDVTLGAFLYLSVLLVLHFGRLVRIRELLAEVRASRGAAPAEAAG